MAQPGPPLVVVVVVVVVAAPLAMPHVPNLRAARHPCPPVNKALLNCFPSLGPACVKLQRFTDSLCGRTVEKKTAQGSSRWDAPQAPLAVRRPTGSLEPASRPRKYSLAPAGSVRESMVDGHGRHQRKATACFCKGTIRVFSARRVITASGGEGLTIGAGLWRRAVAGLDSDKDRRLGFGWASAQAVKASLCRPSGTSFIVPARFAVGLATGQAGLDKTPVHL
ncbi:hypothetical protein EDB80DRAFT_679555 [Ilyonectria destructans]|nr:hypothetical protein EDB80DRAFT_679555 [Ilyonectria destructans]